MRLDSQVPGGGVLLPGPCLPPVVLPDEVAQSCWVWMEAVFPWGVGVGEGSALPILDDVNFDICPCACVSWVCSECQSCCCDK